MTTETATVNCTIAMGFLSIIIMLITHGRLKNNFRYALGISHLIIILTIFFISVNSRDAQSVFYWFSAVDLDRPISFLAFPLAEILGQYVKIGFDIYALAFFGIVGSTQYFLIGALIDMLWLRLIKSYWHKLFNG